MSNPESQLRFARGGVLLLAIPLLFVLLALFWNGLVASRTVFSNDGPLGAISTQAAALPSGFLGNWQDLNWVGIAAPSSPPNLTQVLALLVGKVIFSKVFAPAALFFLGLSAWVCFRSWNWSPAASVVGGLAAALNSDFFSTAAWGVAAQPIAFGFIFLALAALANPEGPARWSRRVLAGFAVGLAVTEAFDIGAIFSLIVAAFVFYQALVREAPVVQRLTAGATRVAVVALAAALISASALTTLVGTQIKGVAVQEQSREEKWDWATQWSLSKRETLGILVPGLFGFRMDTPDGGSYWGIVGRSPAWERYYAGVGPRPAGGHRFGGGGQYAGTLVLMLAAWAAVQSFRRQSPFSLQERRFAWFWLAVAAVALLLCWGRFGPFYQFFYALPFASTIRNPAKFIHVVEFCIVILFAQGTNLLVRQYLGSGTAPTATLTSHLRSWWGKAPSFDRKWVAGLVGALGIGTFSWLVYTTCKAPLVRYLQEVDFDEATASAIADFSIRQPLWVLLFLALGAGLMTVILSGFFRGRAGLATALLGLLLTLDLARANVPWVVTYNWRERYASNPVLDFLRKDAHLHRVALLPLEPPPQLSLLHNLYRLEWAQHQFLYYNIQSLDVVQMPRPPVDMEAFESALRPVGEQAAQRLVRRWELTNTRYLLGPAGFLDFLNQQLDAARQRFRIALRFDLVPRPGIVQARAFEDLTAVPAPEGPYAVFEFTGALPRTRLHTQWTVLTDGARVLERLADRAFDPHTGVLLLDPVPESTSSTGPVEAAGTVEVARYAPKEIEVRVKADADAILLYNDRWDPNWRAELNGQPVELLRANYLMRAVKVPPGEHVVRLSFAPPLTGLYISLASILVGVGLLALVGVSRRRGEGAADPGEAPR